MPGSYINLLHDDSRSHKFLSSYVRGVPRSIVKVYTADLGSLRCKKEADGAAKTRGATRDQGDTVLQSAWHCCQSKQVSVQELRKVGT